ncbi:nucleoside deaminase [Candidatus Infernicultor aquiphilus]|uniref:tRNA-specific adenosine deaminase n=2 Tax=Candidatus Infernicultor aquiphilus TaxID=1805029 RepID=A0A1J5GWZ0_9BACT|nr:MAG: tRNA-specific adenosine deaminase [Candidatus Atribacteria bacterium CG2_30_33_13]
MLKNKDKDIELMQEALKEAEIAYSHQEVPIGAVVVYQNKIIARVHNRKEELQDPTAHAEILALQEAARYLGSWHLEDLDLYVTLEPCPMCAYAMLQARIKRLIFGTPDPKAGAAGSIINIVQDKRFNHQIEVVSGVLEEECRLILQRFFQERR